MLILLAAIDLVLTMIGDSAVQEVKTIPLSHNTICKRIEKIADDINDQLVTNMRGNEFSLQIDEATISTSSKDANLLCYVQFIDKNGDIVEDLFFCKPILLSCKAHDLFAILNNFFTKNNVDWKYCVSLCTDGAVLCLVASVGYK